MKGKRERGEQGEGNSGTVQWIRGRINNRKENPKSDRDDGNHADRFEGRPLNGKSRLEPIDPVGAPERVALRAPYPNPARSVAQVPYALPEAAVVEIVVFNVLGQRVATLINGQQAKGRGIVTMRTEGLPSGLYFVQMRVGPAIQTQRIVVAR